MYLVISKTAVDDCIEFLSNKHKDKYRHQMIFGSPTSLESEPFFHKRDAVSKAKDLAMRNKKDYDVYKRICTATSSCSVEVKCEEQD